LPAGASVTKGLALISLSCQDSACRFFYAQTPSTVYTIKGNTLYDTSQIPDMPFASALHKNYELHCDAPHDSCLLVAPNSQSANTIMDRNNMPPDSAKYFYDGLGLVSLNCTGTGSIPQGTLSSKDTCQLSFTEPGTKPGKVGTLNLEYVPDDHGLHSSLQKAILTCANKHTTCQLSTTGNSTLDKSNLSPYYAKGVDKQGKQIPDFTGLKNYNLSCYDPQT
jgi:hypothetical protein